MTLYPDELVLLLKLRTNRREANQIIDRNCWALAALEELWMKRDDDTGSGTMENTSLGCPHCVYNDGAYGIQFMCHECRYKEISNPPRFMSPCVYVRFGGVCLEDLLCISLTPYGIIVSCPKSRDDLESARVFLKGHIEWAHEVIRRGGAE